MNLLITASEPLGGDRLNPSLLIARALVDGVRVALQLALMHQGGGLRLAAGREA